MKRKLKIGNWYATLEKEGPIKITKNNVLNIMLFKKIVDDKFVFDTYVIAQDRLFLNDLWFKYEFDRKSGANILDIDHLKSRYKRMILSAVLRGRIGEDK